MGLFDRFFGSPRIRVRMLASVGDHVAGEQYDVPVEIADQWIARGYAEGRMSRDYSEDELQALRQTVQTISI